jgi:hypothetical protein
MVVTHAPSISVSLSDSPAMSHAHAVTALRIFFCSIPRRALSLVLLASLRPVNWFCWRQKSEQFRKSGWAFAGILWMTLSRHSTQPMTIYRSNA